MFKKEIIAAVTLAATHAIQIGNYQAFKIGQIMNRPTFEATDASRGSTDGTGLVQTNSQYLDPSSAFDGSADYNTDNGTSLASAYAGTVASDGSEDVGRGLAQIQDEAD